jgi:hypothetical protein
MKWFFIAMVLLSGCSTVQPERFQGLRKPIPRCRWNGDCSVVDNIKYDLDRMANNDTVVQESNDLE